MILHVQKVAGISGSEAHLLSLLPGLRERGWDVRMLMLHEDEQGAWDFARALEARGVPLDAIRVRADVDPFAFLKLVAYLVRMRPELLHTHLVHAEWYALLAGTVARVPVRFTTKHGCKLLVWYAAYEDLEQARLRELQMKKWKRRDYEHVSNTCAT